MRLFDLSIRDISKAGWAGRAGWAGTARLPAVPARPAPPADGSQISGAYYSDLIRWNTIVDYMKLASSNSDRVRYRELGKTSNGNPFIVLEISSADTLKNVDRNLKSQ
jgi:hypothetical protein